MEETEERRTFEEVIRSVIDEYVSIGAEARREPAYKAELVEERRRREQLETRVNELVEENKRSRQVAEESDRHSQIRGGTAAARSGEDRPGVQGRAGRDRARRGRVAGCEDAGRRTADAGVPGDVRERESRVSAGADCGGSGVAGPQRGGQMHAALDLEKIQPGMSAEELQRVREQIAQLALQSLRGE